MEDYSKTEQEPEWEMEDWQKEALSEAMGIKEDEQKPGEEFISYK
jgi:hypothetical protein